MNDQQNTNSLSYNTIRLSQILNQTEFNNLLQQSSISQQFDNFLLNDILNHSQQIQQPKQPIHILKNILSVQNKQAQNKQAQNKQVQNKQSINKKDNQIKLYEQAYQRTYNNKNKLLNNPFFNFQHPNQTNHQQQQIHQQQNDYFKQYQKWKQQKQTNNTVYQKNNQLKKEEQKLSSHIKHKINFSKEFQIFDQSSVQYSKKYQKDFIYLNEQKQIPHQNKLPKQQQSFSIDQQLKKIHQQYLSKITQITNQNISQIHTKTNIISNLPQISNTNQMRQSPKTNNLIASNNLINNQPQQLLDLNIHDYCFENMIQNKPKPIKNIHFQNLQNISQFNPLPYPHQISQISSLQTSVNPVLSYTSYPQNQNQSNLKTTFKNNSFIANQSFYPNDSYTQEKPLPKVKLNIDKLLSLGYKEFLIFFETNHRKIITMTQPQDYAKLESYQIKCLQHAQSIQKLREKFNSQKGAKLVKKLSIQQKQKLFRILYE